MGAEVRRLRKLHPAKRRRVRPQTIETAPEGATVEA